MRQKIQQICPRNVLEATWWPERFAEAWCTSGSYPFGAPLARKWCPEGRSWDSEGAKLGPKIEKMLWKKTSENRCCKSVENHVKFVGKLLPNAWENRQVYIAFRKRHERQKKLENTCIFKIFACRSWYKSTKNNATNIVKIMLQKTCVNWAKIASKREPKSARKGSGVRKKSNRKQCWNWVPFKSFKNWDKSVQGAILIRIRVKDPSSSGQFSRAAAPRGRPQVHALVKRKKGSGRKKEEPRKKE